MFESLFSSLRAHSGDAQDKTKRRFSRRDCDKCVSVINNKTYPVENWSMGGLLINGDSRPFGIDNEIEVMMKFRLRDRIMNIVHKARVVRKSKSKVAFEFLPLQEHTRRTLQNVVDDYVTGEFADSQLT